MNNPTTVGELEAIRRFDTCTLANAIERFKVRPRNEGFVTAEATCRFPDLPPVVGYAVTGRIQTYMPPMTGRCYYDHFDWWQYLMTTQAPRFVVLRDIDSRPGFGALFGEMHAHICRAMNCTAFLTNGAVRDLGAVEPLGFQLYSGSVSVSHAYAHIVDYGEPVEIGGLIINPGDILHGDRHGVLSVPRDVLADLPKVASQIRTEEAELVELTQRGSLSVEALAKKIEKFSERHLCR
ncbi:MAG TPA: RraA family protein [Verrucomicrobiae bacterium]|nr:RraA family protein [Verrucomicrobiae bacterium]